MTADIRAVEAALAVMFTACGLDPQAQRAEARIRAQTARMQARARAEGWLTAARCPWWPDHGREGCPDFARAEARP